MLKPDDSHLRTSFILGMSILASSCTVCWRFCTTKNPSEKEGPCRCIDGHSASGPADVLVSVDAEATRAVV